MRSFPRQNVAVTLALTARILLALVLGGAAIGKFQDLEDSRQMMIDFGLPFAVAQPLGTLVPVMELAVAIPLLVPAWSWYAAWAALGLVGAFTLAIAANMAMGRRPDCRCFGALHIATVGWRALSRNLLLLGLAGIILWRG
jgi:uncharacterized membrane protein YphA (DoxX/SURF4 family)